MSALALKLLWCPAPFCRFREPQTYVLSRCPATGIVGAFANIIRKNMKAVSVFLPALAALSACVLAQVPDTLKRSFFDPDTALQARAAQGASVAVEGNYAVVGVPGDDISNGDDGVVKVYHLPTGMLLHTLINPSPGSNDQFGNAVAISGTRVVVGAFYDSSSGEENGRAYIYDLASATPTTPTLTLDSPFGLSDNHKFGSAVAISGTIVLVGAQQAQAAYVYDLASATPDVPVLELSDPTEENDNFGWSAAISGTTLVIGTFRWYDFPVDAPPDKVFVYDLSAPTPGTPALVLTDPHPAPNNGFGKSVAISGRHVVVGAFYDDTTGPDAGRAYVYDLAGAAPADPVLALPSPSAHFGASVAMSGSRVLIGALQHELDPAANDAGSAYLYDVTSATPAVPLITFNHPSGSVRARFGSAVAIAGTRLLIGAPLDDALADDAGSAFAYELTAASPTQPVAILNRTSLEGYHRFGTSVAVSGTRLVVGSRAGTGFAYVYDLASTAAAPVRILPNPSPHSSGFGSSVAISGKRVVIGAPADDAVAESTGRAYIYDLDSANPTLPVLTFNNPTPAPFDGFGHAVAISGTWVVIGAPYDDQNRTDAGSAYVYDLTSANPYEPVHFLRDPGPTVQDEQFGISVAISGTRIVVGSRFDNRGTANEGSAYIYDLASVTPALPVSVLRNPSLTGFDDFANAVAISGPRVVVGAYQYGYQVGTTGYGPGRTYLYDLTSATPETPALTLENPLGRESGGFGYSVAMSGTRIVIGGPSDVGGFNSAGLAYLYDLMSPTPAAPVATLHNPSPYHFDFMGNSVAIDGTTVAVGAFFDDTNAGDRGAAYVFGPGPFSLWKINELGDAFAPALGDAERDGLVNLLEYALVLSPTRFSMAPTPTAFTYADGNRLRLILERDPARNDVTIEVQATGDLRDPWTTIAISALGAPFSGPGYVGGDNADPGIKTVEFRDVANIESASQRFLRVKVTR